MKRVKKYITLSLVSIMLTMTACSRINQISELINRSNDSEKSIESTSSRIENDDIEKPEILNDLSVSFDSEDVKEFVEGYEYAEFDKYNSYATENGFGGSSIYITGELVNVNLDGEYNVYGDLQTDDSEIWLFELAGMGDDQICSYLEGINAVIVGIYAGYSKAFEKPYIWAKRIYDLDHDVVIETNISKDMDYDDWKKWFYSDRFVTDNSIRYKEIGYSAPFEWGDPIDSDDDLYRYYYPENGLVMIYTFETSIHINEEYLEGYLGGVEEGTDNYKEESRTAVYFEDASNCWQVDYHCYIKGYDCYVRMYIIELGDTVVTVTYTNYNQKDNDKLEVFDQMVSTIHLENADNKDTSLGTYRASFYDVSFDVPNNFILDEDDGSMVWYVSDSCHFTINYYEAYDVFLQDEDLSIFADGFIENVSMQLDNFVEEKRVNKTLDNGENCVMIDCSWDMNDTRFCTRIYFFAAKGNVYNFTFSSYGKKDSGNLDRFDKMVNSVKY